MILAAEDKKNPLLAPGKCKGLWRPDTLPGKCIGINPTREFNDLKDIKINNSNECRALCCNLNERCTTVCYTAFLHSMLIYVYIYI